MGSALASIQRLCSSMGLDASHPLIESLLRLDGVVPGGGGPSPAKFALVPFTYGTPSPLNLVPVPAGAVVDLASIVIETPFDSPAATLRLGTGASPDLFLAATQNDPRMAAEFAADEDIVLALGGTLTLTLSPAGSTAGSGYVFVRYYT